MYTAVESQVIGENNVVIKDKTVRIECGLMSDIRIYSIDGKLITQCRDTQQYAVNLDAGLYIIEIQDSKTNKKQHKKVYVK